MMKILSTLTIISSLSTFMCEPELPPIVAKIADLKLSEDGRLNFTNLVSKYGHKAEEYHVTTEDGYILKLFRIPGPKSPVLLSHGLITDADTWVVRNHDSLGMALADAGYDVWFGNNRGTKHSRRHVKLDPDSDKAFWDYSFHEMGYYDLASTIDFVCAHTGEEKIFSIGHSQGCTQHFTLLSLKPEYNDKLKLFIGLAPAAFFANMPPSFKLFGDSIPLLNGVLAVLGIEELFKDRGALNALIRLICTKGIIGYELCVEAIIFPFVGSNHEGTEPEFLPTLAGHAPSGASRKTLVHYNQVYLNQKFGQWDYGLVGNLQKYGSVCPPEYDLSKITVDAALVAGTLDKIVLVENTKTLAKKLPNVVDYQEVKATHNDFVLGKDARVNLFPTVFRILKKYEPRGSK